MKATEIAYIEFNITWAMEYIFIVPGSLLVITYTECSLPELDHADYFSVLIVRVF